ncbi:tail fiber protein [Paenibacillus amylolyticus]|uniref:tail fiber protein n=1 Tax=Paenibacillus amylolyticus TaxID=1451 RepID=UPI003EBE2B83
MAQLPMYAAAVNSPSTELASDINATDTSIDVLDASKLPAAPNLVTVGGDETAETILYTGKTGNTLTGCTRGFEGTAKGWAAGSLAARNHTAYDYEAGRANIADLDTRVSNIVIPDGTTAQKGIVQLSDSADGTRSTVAATEKAVNDARVAAISAAASDATTKANAAQTAAQTALNSHANINAASSEAHGMRVRSGKLEYYDGSNWLAASSGIDLTTTVITYYVNASTGDDNNDGLSASQAFKTINKAVSLIPDIMNNGITINLAAGNYTENVVAKNKMGTGWFRITGPSSGGAIITGLVALNSINLPIVYLSYLSVLSGGDPAISVLLVDLLNMSSVTLTEVSTSVGVTTANSSVQMSNCTISNKNVAIQAATSSTIFSLSNTGSGNTTVLYATGASTIIKAGTQPTGTTAEITSVGGLIRS